MNLFMAYRNFVRPRHNGEKKTPAQLLGFVAKRMSPTDLLNWRQDWGWFSIHPLSRRTTSIRAVRARERSRKIANL